MEFDFGGYATKNDLLCSDGRTIKKDAFKINDGQTVPLVWEHDNSTPENVLGHALLTNREDGVYAQAKFNNNPLSQTAKESVRNGDIKSLSIKANQLLHQGMDVVKGQIREVSLVLAGANPGALIDFVGFEHGFDSDDEAIITTGIELELAHADEEDDETVEDVFNTLNDKQKSVVYAMIAQALDENLDEEDDNDNNDDTVEQSDTEGTTIVHNVFESGSDTMTANASGPKLTHSQIRNIMETAEKGGSLKDAVLQHAGEYGITNIELLFPEARSIRNTPDFVKRQTEWVTKVLDAASKSPFSRIRSMSADITLDTARAKGYVKATMKKEEFFAVAKRETTPQTVYKKQKLDRDDIIDITDFDVVAWIKAEMHLMLKEELARAILIGDGREVDDPDKIKEDKIRPIATDDDFYTHKVRLASDAMPDDIIEAVIRARKNYKGTGAPTMFTTEDVITDMLLIRDTTGRRIYRTEAELAAELRVKELVAVEVMEGHVDSDGNELMAVLVNMTDYTIGADRGGEINFFDDFDIDFNQKKYLYETRVSGALTLPKSAVAVLVAPATP